MVCSKIAGDSPLADNCHMSLSQFILASGRWTMVHQDSCCSFNATAIAVVSATILARLQQRVQAARH